MRDFSQFEWAWSKWPNCKYAYGAWPTNDIQMTEQLTEVESQCCVIRQRRLSAVATNAFNSYV